MTLRQKQLTLRLKIIKLDIGIETLLWIYLLINLSSENNPYSSVALDPVLIKRTKIFVEKFPKCLFKLA